MRIAVVAGVCCAANACLLASRSFWKWASRHFSETPSQSAPRGFRENREGAVGAMGDGEASPPPPARVKPGARWTSCWRASARSENPYVRAFVDEKPLLERFLHDPAPARGPRRKTFARGDRSDGRADTDTTMRRCEGARRVWTTARCTWRTAENRFGFGAGLRGPVRRARHALHRVGALFPTGAGAHGGLRPKNQAPAPRVPAHGGAPPAEHSERGGARPRARRGAGRDARASWSACISAAIFRGAPCSSFWKPKRARWCCARVACRGAGGTTCSGSTSWTRRAR